LVTTTKIKGGTGLRRGQNGPQRKRHILVDTLKLVLLINVHPANVQHRGGANRV